MRKILSKAPPPHLLTLRRKLADFLPFFKKTYEAMASEVGWVGWFPIGGIDERGNIVAVQ